MLEICNIHKGFGNQIVLSNVQLTIQRGEFFSILGPSGCGKSTLLRILAGLESADSGEIKWNGQRIDTRPARERPFNMVFQRYALFPHLTVAENVAFGLQLKNVERSEIQTRVRETLTLVNLGGFENRRPETLSGGQSQRVALARALINRPECVLLDEPLSALDRQLREHMQSELRLLQKRLGLAFIFVTHDQEEAMGLSDRIAVMNNGRLEAVCTPRELHETPQSLFCARFVGQLNELPAQHFGQSGGRVFFRPERVQCVGVSDSLSGRATGGTSLGAHGAHRLSGRVTNISFRGLHDEITVALEDGSLLRFLRESSLRDSLPSIDAVVSLTVAPESLHFFSESTS